VLVFGLRLETKPQRALAGRARGCRIFVFSHKRLRK
jgi:hypothetical protein